ncbi:MAG: putative Ig domain-containing protein, partial [Defluviitaleaceae bacterium]|nr:putative Ig domain-containing protein [Defluviitaleaceae bacterium]
SRNISANPYHGAVLSHTTHNSAPIAVSYSTFNANTNNLTVNRADPTVTWPSGLTATVGQTLSNITLPGNGTGAGTFTWTAPGDSVGAEGTQSHYMTFTPADGDNFNTITQNVTLTVNPAPTPPVITTAPGALTGGTFGTPYSVNLAASNNPTSWTSTSGTLPTGLVLNNSGLISGTPTAAGNFTFYVTATNADGTSPAVSFSINIAQIPLSIGIPSAVTYTNNHLDRNALTPILGTVNGNSYTERTATFTVAVSGFASDADATIVGLSITAVTGLLFSGITAATGNTTGGVKTFTVTVTYNGTTAFPTDSAAINITGLTGVPSGYVFDGTTRNTSVNIIDGQADDAARAIPVTQENIQAFNAYADAAPGRTRHYKLTQNIDATHLRGIIEPSADDDSGSNWTPIFGLAGSFDGQGHTITGMVIRRAGGQSVGMFDTIGILGSDGVVGVVRNLGLVSGSFTSSSNAATGSIVGINAGTISNCFSIGSVTGQRSQIGGLAGRNDSMIENSFSVVAVTVINPTITPAHASFMGGIAGDNRGTIQNSAALNPSVAGRHQIETDVNRISNVGTGTLANNFAWAGMDVRFNIENDGTGGTAKTIANGGAGAFDNVDGLSRTATEIRTQSTWTAAGFDFTAIWEWDNSGVNMPRLRNSAWIPWPAHLHLVDPAPPTNIIDLSITSPPANGSGWSFNSTSDASTNDIYTILDGANVIVTGSNTGSQRRLAVEAGATATITLNGMSITGLSGSTALLLGSNSNVTLYLADGTTNTLTGGSGAGIITSQATLIINGSTGTLIATGSDSAAGIGGGNNSTGGTVTINGGTVTATGGSNAAGIGGGSLGHGGTVTINGGTVTATGGTHNPTGINNAAGIGGGNAGFGGIVTINGGTVIATGFRAIGAGRSINNNGTLTMSGYAVAWVHYAGANAGAATVTKPNTELEDDRLLGYLHIQPGIAPSSAMAPLGFSPDFTGDCECDEVPCVCDDVMNDDPRKEPDPPVAVSDNDEETPGPDSDVE